MQLNSNFFHFSFVLKLQEICSCIDSRGEHFSSVCTLYSVVCITLIFHYNYWFVKKCLYSDCLLTRWSHVPFFHPSIQRYIQSSLLQLLIYGEKNYIMKSHFTHDPIFHSSIPRQNNAFKALIFQVSFNSIKFII